MSNPKCAEARQKAIDQNPFSGFNIDNNSILDELEGRHPCPQCGKSRKFYCYSCYIPIAELKGKLPVVKVHDKLEIILSIFNRNIFSCL